MDVEQAMAWAEWAKSAGSEEHMQKAARAAVTLAAEVRRLAGAVPAGHVRDEKGEDVPFVGTLPRTKDGVIVGNHAALWVNDIDAPFSLRVDNIGCTDVEGCDDFFEVGEMYATRAAAEAAREGRGT